MSFTGRSTLGDTWMHYPSMALRSFYLVIKVLYLALLCIDVVAKVVR